MANAVTTSPMVLDSTGVVTTAALYITHIRWVPVDGSTMGNIILLSDKNGNELWRHEVADIGTATNAFVSGSESSFAVPMFAAGLTVTTIGSGKVYVNWQHTRNN